MITGLRQASRTRDQIADAKKDLTESFKSYKSLGAIYADTQFQLQVAELVRQLAVSTFELSDPTPLFVNRQSAELGQTIELEQTVNTMKAVRRHPGSHPAVFTPTKRKFGISTKQYDLAFGMDLEKILRRQLDPGVFVDHAGEALSRLYVETVLGAIDAAVTGTDQYGFSVRTTVATAVDQTSIDAAVKRMGDVNGDVFIAGRYSALFPITQFAGYTNQQIFGQDQLNQIHSTGMIGKYKGCSLVILRDDFNWFYNTASINNNRIYVGGSDKGATLFERNVSALDYQSIDTERAWLKSGFRVDFGVTVLQPWKYHIIAIT